MPGPRRLIPSYARKPEIRPPNENSIYGPPKKIDINKLPYYSQIDWKTESSPSQVEEAREFIKKSLGWYGEPPVEGAGVHYEHLMTPNAWGGQRKPATIREDTSDIFKQAVESLIRQHPVANTVAGYGQDPEIPKGIGAYYYPGTEFISTNPNKDEYNDPNSYNDLMGTLRHELGHHLGALDKFDTTRDLYPVEHTWDRSRHNEFSAYDIGMQSDRLLGDVFLPSREADIAEEERRIQNLKGGYKLRPSIQQLKPVKEDTWTRLRRSIEDF